MNKFLAIKIQQKVKIGSQIPCFFNIRYPTKISDFLGIRLRLFIFTIRSDPNPTFYYPKISVSDIFGIRSITKFVGKYLYLSFDNLNMAKKMFL